MALLGALATGFRAALAQIHAALLALRGAALADFGAGAAKGVARLRTTGAGRGTGPTGMGTVDARACAVGVAVEARVGALLANAGTRDARFET